MLNTLICTPQYLAVTEKSYTFAPLLDQEPVSNRRRDGRVVDYNGLENRRAERHRGFESLSLRKTKGNELKFNELPFNFVKSVDAEWTKILQHV